MVTLRKCTAELMGPLPRSPGEVFPEVNPLMLAHVGTVPEGFPTLATLIGLLPSVDPPVLDEVSTLAKGFLAITAFVRLFPVV